MSMETMAIYDTILSWAASPKPVTIVAGFGSQSDISNIFEINEQYPYWACVNTYDYGLVASMLLDLNIGPSIAFWCSEGSIVIFKNIHDEIKFILACKLEIIPKCKLL